MYVIKDKFETIKEIFFSKRSDPDLVQLLWIRNPT
jgi:hypothetical protein